MNLSNEAIDFLLLNDIKNYTLNSDGTIDVDEGVNIITKQSKFPVKFGKVSGHFYCDNTQLTSLEGVPSYVGGYFSCGGINNYLISLHDVHKHVKEINGAFYCFYGSIKTSVLGILLIKGVTRVFIENREVQNIIKRHLGQGRAGVIGAQQDLLDAGLDEYARL